MTRKNPNNVKKKVESHVELVDRLSKTSKNLENSKATNKFRKLVDPFFDE